MAVKTIPLATFSGKTLYLSALSTAARSLCSTQPDFSALLRRRCLSGTLGLDEAIGYFNSLVEIRPLPDIWNFNHLFGSLSKMGHYSVVVSMHRALSGFADFRPQVGTLTIVMDCFCRLERMDFGFAVLGAIMKRGLVPNARTLCTLLRALCAVGAADVAVELFEEIVAEGFPCNEFTYAALINGLCKAGEVRKALGVLRRMYGDGRVCVDGNCFGPVIDAFCKERRVGEGLGLFEEMVMRGVSPHVVVCNSLVQGLCKCGRWEEASRFFIDMPRRYNVSHDVRTYNVIIDALCKDGRCQEAVSLFRLMIDRGLEPTVVTFSSMLLSLCRCGQLEEGSQMFGSMNGFGVFPNILMFTTMFDALCKRGKIVEALSLVEEMTSRGINPDVFIYTSLIQGLCNLHKVDCALSVFGTMVKRGIRANERTLASLLHGLCAEGDMVSAMKFFQRIVEKDRMSNEFSYAIMIHGLCKTGQVNKALEILDQMGKNPRIKPDVMCYNPIIVRLSKERRVDEALIVFETMISHGVLPDSFTCNPLIQGLCRAGRSEEANGFLANMFLKHTISPRDTLEAISLFKSITSYDVQPSVVTLNYPLSASGNGL